MQVYNSNFLGYQDFSSPNFEGITNFNLTYVIQKRKHLVPIRIQNEIKKILRTKPATEPTLRDLHLKTYAPLLECKTLDEARNLFPEFREVLDAAIFENSPSKNIQEVKKHIQLKDLSLKLLQDTWAKLKTQDEIAQELGLQDGKKLDWFKSKINFVNKDKNYNPLLKVSEPELRKIIAAQTTAYNKAHPEKMFAHNKMAAQGCKKPENRAKQKIRSTQMYIDYPHLREQVRLISQMTWDRLPTLKEKMSEFALECPPYTREVLKKMVLKKGLTPAEERIRKKFYKDFWCKYPELRDLYKQTRQAVANEIKSKNKTGAI